MPAYLDPRNLAFISALATASACVLDGKVGDNPSDGSSDSGDDESDDGSTDGGSTSEGDSGSAGVCPIDDSFTCGDGVDCSMYGCGGLFDAFDDNGCPRPGCSACGPDEVCFTPIDWGGCAASGTACELMGDVCECGGTADCNGSYCVPAEQAPPADCFAIDDAEACMAAGCSEFATGPEIVIDESGQCDCGDPVGACLWFSGGIGGAASPQRFFNLSTGQVVFFDTAYIEPPLGWQSCASAGEQGPPACQCFEDFSGCQ